MRSEETQGVQNFLHVGAGGFYNPILFQRRAHRDASRPGSHREGVDDEKRLTTQGVTKKVATDPARIFHLDLRPHPVVRQAC